MKPAWLSVEELAVIHEEVLEATGGVQGILHPGNLESALARPFTVVAGKEMFPSLTEKVAALVEGLVVFHPFADGNKRTALVAADVCLRLNGRRLATGSEEAMEALFWAIARGEKSAAEITEWMEAHTEPV
jgi:death on curing protein